MDAQATLITTLLVHNDKEPTEVTKCLCPLAKKVYSKVLPEKYNRPAFMKFYRDDNPLFDHIKIFEIMCKIIATNEKPKLQ